MNDHEAVRSGLLGRIAAGDWHEVRCIFADGRVASRLAGSADDVLAMLASMAPDLRAAYMTLNPVRADLVGAASAADVLRRSHLLLDFDPPRPPGTNASNPELEVTRDLAVRVVAHLQTLGWPAPRMGWSGNGVHCLYRIDLPNTDESTRLIRAILARASAEHSTDAVKIDTTVFDAPRICRIWGTINKKAEQPTDERPHRMSGPWPFAGDIVTAPVEVLRAYAEPYLSKAVEAAQHEPSAEWSSLPEDEQARVIEELRSALSKWDADDRAEWVAAGHALHGLGDAGFALWSEFSARSTRYPGGHGLEKWHTFKGDRTGYQAIFAKAQSRGWVNPRALNTAAVGFGQGVATTPSIARPVPTSWAGVGDARDGTENTLPLNQSGTAERLALKLTGALIFAHGAQRWLKWESAWRRSDEAQVLNLILTLAHQLVLQDAMKRPPQEAPHFAAHGRKCGDVPYASGILRALAGHPKVRITDASLDADPWLIGFDEGRQVADGRTGTVRAAVPSDYITRSFNVSEIGEVVKAVRWLQFLREVFCNDLELIDWVHRFCGYAATALTSEHAFLFLFGHGANGKSVFTEVLRDLFGDYCVAMQTATLCDDKRTGAAASPDLARLDGIRLAVAPETEAGSTIAESLVKGLIAGDVMSVRVPYGMPFDMRPVLKLMMTGNHKPRISGTDRGIWRRVRLVPFLADFTGRADKGLIDKLKAEKPHIFAWIVAGCVEWQKRGLSDTPRAVAAATEEYRADEDLLGQWLDECCEQAPAAETKAADLYSSFSHWAARSGIQRPWTAAVFGKRLGEYRVGGWLIGERRTSAGRLRTGIRLKLLFPLPSFVPGP